MYSQCYFLLRSLTATRDLIDFLTTTGRRHPDLPQGYAGKILNNTTITGKTDFRHHGSTSTSTSTLETSEAVSFNCTSQDTSDDSLFDQHTLGELHPREALSTKL